jgi:hypothetical protein
MPLKYMGNEVQRTNDAIFCCNTVGMVGISASLGAYLASIKYDLGMNVEIID